MQKKHELKLIYCTIHKNATIINKAVGLTSSKHGIRKKESNQMLQEEKRYVYFPKIQEVIGNFVTLVFQN